MSLETAFAILNNATLVGWLLLVLVPRWKGTRLWVRSGALSFALSLVYGILIFTNWNIGAGSFNSLAGVAALFSNPGVLLAGWVHYLAFDLFVGVWITGDAEAKGVPRWLVIPCLIFTFLLGPLGYALYRGSARFSGGKR